MEHCPSPGRAITVLGPGENTLLTLLKVLSDRILKAMGKGCDTAAMRKSIGLAREAGIGVDGNFVLG